MKDRHWRGDRGCLNAFISSYLYWLQVSWTLIAEIFTSVGQKEKKWSTSLVARDCHTWGQAVKLCRFYRMKENIFSWWDTEKIDDTSENHWSWTHIDWSADEESSEYWRPPSSVGGHEVLWPRETPGSPSDLRTTTLQRFTVLKICSLTCSSRVDTNRAAERCRRVLHHCHLKHREKIRGTFHNRETSQQKDWGGGQELKDCSAVSQLVALQLQGEQWLLVHFC